MNRISENREAADKSKTRKGEENYAILNFLESAGAVFFRTDEAGNLTYLSPGFSGIHGKSPSDFAGHSVFELFRGAEEEAASAITQLRQGSNLIKIRLDEVHFSDSDLFAVEFTLRPCLNQRGEWEGIEGISLNMNENNPENRIHQLEVRLEEAEKIKERFLSNISHEIRTPLNGILGMVQLLQSTLLDSDQQEFIQIISKSGENLLQTLNQLIDLSLDPGGKLKLQEDEIEISTLFSLMSGLYSEQAKLKKIHLDFQVKGLIPCLLSDEFRIQQVLKQLISNALRFSDSGQIHVSARLENKNGSPLLILEVSDTGHGIELSRQPVIESILQKDGTSDKSFARALGGLGLLTVRMICNALNAEPGFVSAPGNGSTFWVKIPVKLRISEPGNLPDHAPETREFIRKVAPKILVTDDNAVNLKVASEILSRAGCRVVLASNGKEAVEKANKEFFHLIFMDIQMPVMDGMEASRKIQKLRLENAPAIVAMTAYVMNEDKKRFLEAGMDDFIAKPISGDQLISRVRHWTEKSLLKNPESEIIYRSPELSDNELFRVFDLEVIRNLRRHIGEEILLSSLDEFAEELREILDGVAASLETRNSEELERYFHTLKGNAGTFGLNQMSAIAQNLENDLYSKDFAEVIADFHRLEESSVEFLNSYTLLRTNYEWKN
jgi:signal transduction histidine kinase/DNA-binding response OmpR family regulator